MPHHPNAQPVKLNVSSDAPLSRDPQSLDAVVQTLASEVKQEPVASVQMAGEKVPQELVSLAAMTANAPPPRDVFEPAPVKPSMAAFDSSMQGQRSMFAPIQPANVMP